MTRVMLPSGVHGATTETVGFFGLPAAEFAAALHRAFGDAWSMVGPVDAGLDDVAATLPPGQVPGDWYAVVDLGDRWCAVFTDGPLGTDVGVLPSWTARSLGAVGVRATAVANDRARKREGGTVLEVYDPAMVDAHPLACRRTLAAVNDGGRWTVEASGEPFDFEDPDAELDADLLRRYLSDLGIPDWDGRPVPVIYLRRT